MTIETFIQSQLTDASKLAREMSGRVTSSTKPEDNNQVLTEADLAIGRLLVAAIREQYPEDNIIDEESGVVDNGSRYTWVVDPIDGTSNFAAGLPHYGVMIGRLDGADPVAGGIALPAFDRIFTAEKGRGTRCNGVTVHVSAETELHRALVAYGIDGHQEEPDVTHTETQLLGRIVLAIRNLRTSNSAFDMCAVTLGQYGAMLNRTSKIWDNVAPQIIIEEAGGVYTDFFGSPMNYRDATDRTDENFTVCAGSPDLHAQLQRIIHET